MFTWWESGTILLFHIILICFHTKKDKGEKQSQAQENDDDSVHKAKVGEKKACS